MDAKENILITGFEPFGEYAENISEIAATQLKRLGKYNVYSLVFPVRIFPENGEDYGETILAKAREINAKAIISLGMSSNVIGVRIETRAINWVENQAYCLKSEQRRVIDESLILKKEMKVNLRRWYLSRLYNLSVLIEKLYLQKISCDINFSSDAGTFCYNALMFRTLAAIEKEDCKIPYLFLHVPCSAEAIKNIPDFDKTKDLMTLEKLEKVLAAILGNL